MTARVGCDGPNKVRLKCGPLGFWFLVPPSLASHHHQRQWCTAGRRRGPSTLREDRRRPPPARRPTLHSRTAPAPCRTKPATGMSRVDPVGGLALTQPDRPACAWKYRFKKIHVRELSRQNVAGAPRQVCGGLSRPCRRPSAFDKLRPSTPPDLGAESDDQHLRRGRADHQAANLSAVLWASTSI